MAGFKSIKVERKMMKPVSTVYVESGSLVVEMTAGDTQGVVFVAARIRDRVTYEGNHRFRRLFIEEAFSHLTMI